MMVKIYRVKRMKYNAQVFREEDHPRGKDGKFGGGGGGGEKKTESKKEAGGNREELLKKAIEKDPKLQRWGINKEAIDENGDYIIYHGTNDENYKKIMSEGLKAPDAPRYFTTTTKEEAAKEFAKGYSGDKIIKFAIPLDEITDVLWKGAETSAYNDTQHALKKGFLDKKYIKQNSSPRKFIYRP